MTLRVDVGIDAQRHAGHATLVRGNRSNAIQFTRRLRVNRADLVGDGRLELIARLPHAGEHDVSRLKTSAPGDVDLAPRIGVGPTAERAQQPQQRQRRVGLQRVVNRVGILGKRSVDILIGAADRAGAVNVSRGTDGLDDGEHADAVAEKTCWRGLER
jgi:hypothetical protein